MTTTRITTTEDVAAARLVLGLDSGAGKDEVLGAWKAAVRVTHPDHVDPHETATAEQLTRRLNLARDHLLNDVDGRVIDTSQVRQVPPAARQRNARDAAIGQYRIHPGALVLFILGAVALVVLAVLAFADSGDDADARLEDEAGTGVFSEGGDAAGAPILPQSGEVRVELPAATPEDAVRLLLFAASTQDVEVLRGLLDDDARVDEVRDSAQLLGPDGFGLFEQVQASDTLRCNRSADGLTAECQFDEPAEKRFPAPVQVVRRPGGWRLMGYAS